MSGPKSSRYTLTAEQLKRILEEQERIRKELEEKTRKERECVEALEFLSSVKSKSGKLFSIIRAHEDKLHSNGVKLPDAVAGKFQSFSSLATQLEAVCSAKDKSTHSGLMKAKKQADSIQRELTELYSFLVSATKDLLTKHKIHSDQIIAEGMQVSFASVGIVEVAKDPEAEKVIAVLEELLLLDIPKSLKSEVDKAKERFIEIEDKSAKSNFASITVEPLKKRCLAAEEFIKKQYGEFTRLLDRYSALCQQLEREQTVFEVSEQGMTALKKAVDELECVVKNDAQQRYISETVDDVMREMGYEVIGHRSVHKKSGRSFKSKLLTYEDGTVVNVTESSDGRITMEVGGTDDSDRLPDANERVALRKTMESFCRDFHEIEQRLATRGVIVGDRISMAPPEEAYAQIINLSDYELSDDYKTAAKHSTQKDKTTLKQRAKDD